MTDFKSSFNMRDPPRNKCSKKKNLFISIKHYYRIDNSCTVQY